MVLTVERRKDAHCNDQWYVPLTKKNKEAKGYQEQTESISFIIGPLKSIHFLFVQVVRNKVAKYLLFVMARKETSRKKIFQEVYRSGAYSTMQYP